MKIELSNLKFGNIHPFASYAIIAVAAVLALGTLRALYNYFTGSKAATNSDANKTEDVKEGDNNNTTELKAGKPIEALPLELSQKSQQKSVNTEEKKPDRASTPITFGDKKDTTVKDTTVIEEKTEEKTAKAEEKPTATSPRV